MLTMGANSLPMRSLISAEFNVGPLMSIVKTSFCHFKRCLFVPSSFIQIHDSALQVGYLVDRLEWKSSNCSADLKKEIC